MFIILSSNECTDQFPHNQPHDFTNCFELVNVPIPDKATIRLAAFYCFNLATVKSQTICVLSDLVNTTRLGHNKRVPILDILESKNSVRGGINWSHGLNCDSFSSARIWLQTITGERVVCSGPAFVVLEVNGVQHTQTEKET